MKYSRLLILEGLFFLFATSGWSGTVVHYKIETTQTCQTMEHFGASDVWSMQFVGLWPQKQQEQIADWLFSTQNGANGQPKGIGLSIWRFNVGAGSFEQGDRSCISSGTRTECFLQSDGTYNWSKQQGQRHFLKLAKERGVNYFLAFLNSPPVYYTQNGLATNTGRDATFNLKKDCYEDYARFLSTVVEGIEKHDSIKFNYLCPVNEPDGHWNWIGPKQEGTPATNQEVSHLVKCVSKKFVAKGLDTKILVDESSDYRCLLRTNMTDWQRGYGIRSFFSPDSAITYLGETPNVPRLVVGHSYWTNTPLSNLHDIRCELRDTLNKYNIGFWQTETCIMGNDEEIGGGGGFDRTMKTALYVARIIHYDIVCAGASSWQWWRAIGGDYKDGLMRVYSNNAWHTGRVVDSKLMWALGNYSRFIRPSAVRVKISVQNEQGKKVLEGDTDPKGIMCSAYRNKDGQWVVVAINYSKDVKKFEFDMNNGKKLKWQMYRTSDKKGENLSPVGLLQGSLTYLPPRSITSFISR